MDPINPTRPGIATDSDDPCHEIAKHPSASPSPSPPPQTSFSTLPVEIILLISEHLKLIDLLCLSLCDQRLQQILHKESKRKNYFKPEMLKRLDKDLPGYIRCRICNILHAVSEPIEKLPCYGKDGCDRASLKMKRYECVLRRLQLPKSRPHEQLQEEDPGPVG